MKTMKSILYLVLFLLALTFSSFTYGQDEKFYEGKWDLTLQMDGKESPSWLEIKHSGVQTLVGRFVYASGSARPISEIKLDGNGFSFTIPPQWEQDLGNITIKGSKDGEGLKGTLSFENGDTHQWTADRAPKLPYADKVKWGKTKELFNGKDLTGWKALGENQWIVENGILKSPKSGANLASEEKFNDFKIHVEFKVPEGSNSGIYLRGRYEVQITDDHGSDPSNVLFGGVYGFLTPNEMAANPATEWQTYDITLIGRRVTIVANGKTIISEQNIPGITGGALDSKEGEPGPFYIQGDHGPISFRKFTVTPRVE
ncbi:MAG: hypothetical protein CML05_14120 [Pseudozobellia sp.]|nr:hypothetical protein [Pseudozobellia sp.]|tara:strand:- start:71 stop:1012 length:942 start_codon:yes stop_codon:yes gene_type:complete